MDLDKPLDEIVASRKANRGSRRGGRATSNLGKARGGVRSKYATIVPSQNRQVSTATSALTGNLPGGNQTAKIIVSNLPEDVTEAQIKELFHSTVGPLKSASLSFNEKGRSTGIATVEFARPGDAVKAFQEYNSRMIDQKRPMKVEIVVDPTKRSLAERVGPAPRGPSIDVVKATRGQTRGASRSRGMNRRGTTGRKAAPVTVSDLDDEMEVWRSETDNKAVA